MKRLFVPIILAALFVFASMAQATTVTVTNNVVEITAISADWSWSSTFSGATGAQPKKSFLRVVSIEFIGGAANDIMVIRESVANTGAIIFNRKTPDVDYSTSKYFFGASLRPVVDFSDCTLTAGHKLIIILSE